MTDIVLVRMKNIKNPQICHCKRWKNYTSFNTRHLKDLVTLTPKEFKNVPCLTTVEVFCIKHFQTQF